MPIPLASCSSSFPVRSQIPPCFLFLPSEWAICHCSCICILDCFSFHKCGQDSLGALTRSTYQEHSPGALTAAPPRRVQLTALSLKLFQSEASIQHILFLIYRHLPSVVGRFLTLVPGISENVRFHGEVEDQLTLNTPMGTKLITGCS